MQAGHGANQDAPSDEAWAAIPDCATAPGHRFYSQHFGDLRFVSADRMMADHFEEFATRVAKSVLPEREPRGAFPSVFSQVDTLRFVATVNNRVRSEFTATRYVDNFLAYVSEVVGLLFRLRPGSLSSQEKVSIEEVVKHKSVDSLVAWLADERVNRLSYDGFGKIDSFVSSRFGFSLVSNADHRALLVYAIAQRNLLVHRRGVVDDRFIDVLRTERINVSDYRLGEPLSRIETFNTLPAILSAVKHVEDAVITKFSVPCERLSLEFISAEHTDRAAGDPSLDGIG